MNFVFSSFFVSLVVSNFFSHSVNKNRNNELYVQSECTPNMCHKNWVWVTFKMFYDDVNCELDQCVDNDRQVRATFKLFTIRVAIGDVPRSVYV